MRRASMTKEQRRADNERSRARKAAKIFPSIICTCMCHDLNGGPLHPNKRCICNGGEGLA